MVSHLFEILLYSSFTNSFCFYQTKGVVRLNTLGGLNICELVNTDTNIPDAKDLLTLVLKMRKRHVLES